MTASRSALWRQAVVPIACLFAAIAGVRQLQAADNSLPPSQIALNYLHLHPSDESQLKTFLEGVQSIRPMSDSDNGAVQKIVHAFILAQGVSPSLPAQVPAVSAAIAVAPPPPPATPAAPVAPVAQAAPAPAPANPTTTTSASLTPEQQILGSGGLKYSSHATLLKLNLLQLTTDYSVPWFSGTHHDFWMGISVSAANAVGTPTQKDFVSAQLLARDSGLLNIYFTPWETKKPQQWQKVATALKIDAPPGERSTAVDRFYLGNFREKFAKVEQGSTVPQDIADATEAMSSSWAYVLNGAGLKLYNPAFSTGTAVNELEPAGVAYLGFGIDGGVVDLLTKAPGSWEVEIYGAENVVNRNELHNIFARPYSSTYFTTVTAKLGITVGATSLGLFYSFAPANAASRHMLRDTAGVSFTFAAPTAKAAKP